MELSVHRKDYVLIAAVIAQLENRQAVAEAFAAALAAQNANFNKELFMKACGAL